MKKAFTLPELLVCIAIITVLAALLLPALAKAKAKQEAKLLQKLEAEQPKDNKVIDLPEGKKLVSVDCSLGEIHILIKNQPTHLYTPETFTYYGRRLVGTNPITETFTLVEH